MPAKKNKIIAKLDKHKLPLKGGVFSNNFFAKSQHGEDGAKNGGQNCEAQLTLSKLIEISVKNIPLDEMLAESLKFIISIPWLSVGSKGAIFLVEDGRLVMKAHRGLPDALLENCKSVEIGQCICGRVAASGKFFCSGEVDKFHAHKYKSIEKHGHYCAPLMSADKKVLGIINLYLKKDSVVQKEEMAFLKICANTLAGLIIRKEAEDRLKESEEKFRNLAEQSPNVIFINSRGKIAYINERCKELLGYEKKEISAENFDFMRLISEKSKSKAAEAFNMFRQDEGLPPEEYFLVTKKGREVVVIISIKIIKYEGRRSFLGIITDITEQKKNEKKLRQAKDFLENILNTMSDGVDIIDRDGNIKFMNSFFASMFGKEALGKNCAKAYGIGNCCALRELPEIGKTKTVEISGILENKTFLVSHTGMADSRGEYAILRIFKDITSRKKTEIDLQQEKEDLENKVKERTSELRRANKNLEERIREHQAVEEALLELYRYTGITNRRISMLLDLKRNTEGKTFAETVEYIVDSGTELSGASACALYEYREEKNDFYLLAANGMENGAAKRDVGAEDNVFFRQLIGDKLKVFIEGEKINRDALRGIGVESDLNQVLLFPLFVENKLKFAIFFGFRSHLEFNKQETSFYGAFVMQASAALGEAAK